MLWKTCPSDFPFWFSEMGWERRNKASMLACETFSSNDFVAPVSAELPLALKTGLNSLKVFPQMDLSCLSTDYVDNTNNRTHRLHKVSRFIVNADNPITRVGMIFDF